MEGETILCVATRRWDSMWRESQQHMSRIAARNRVLYFEPGRNPDRRAGGELLRNLRNVAGLPARQVSNNLTVIPTPSSLPYARRHLPRAILRHTTPVVAKVNANILIRRIRTAMEAYHVERPILWLYDARHIDLIGKFGERLVCFYIYDEAHDFVGNERMRDMLLDYYDRMTVRADIVFACSPWIWERRVKLNPNTYCTPNAVDFEAFNRTLAISTPVPGEMGQLKRPIIGTAGMLDDRIDVDLLLRVAHEYPDASLVLVGPDRLPRDERSRRLHAMPNVLFLGEKPHDVLPEYIRAFDVGLIAYVVGPHTIPIYPLKLQEYFATGRSAVGTALPELKKLSPAVRVAETHDDFIGHIDAALADYSGEALAARVAVARENTWDQRVDDLCRAVDGHLVRQDGS